MRPFSPRSGADSFFSGKPESKFLWETPLNTAHQKKFGDL
jgi:hypothetical protein